jgi:hypothetical protein
MDWATAVMLGLVGSLHCAGMCGPLALALPVPRPSTSPWLSPSAAFVLGRFSYNSGRIVTYCLLGMIFGLFGRSLALAGVQRWVSILMGAALIAGLFASARIALWKPVYVAVGRLKAGMGVLLRQPSIASLGVLGLLNGLLPCGLVYVACAGATATGGTFSGAAYMALFGIGTLPMMLAISLSGRIVPFSWRLKLRGAIPVSVFLVATLLILRGMSLGIPYVSPNLSATTPACCHK